MKSTLKTFGVIFLFVSALAGNGAVRAASCDAASVVGTFITADLGHDRRATGACFIAAADPSPGRIGSGSVGSGGNASGFAAHVAFGTDRSALVRLDPGASVAWTLSNQNLASGPMAAMHNADRSRLLRVGVDAAPWVGALALGLDGSSVGGTVSNDSTLGTFDTTVHTPPVPEPESFALMLTGLLVVGSIVGRNRAV